MSEIDLSVVCPVTRHVTDLSGVHREFEEALGSTGLSVEFIYVLDGPWTGAEATMEGIRHSRFPVRVFTMAKGFGEATALQFGFEQAHGARILTVADRPQIDAATVHAVLERLDGGADLVVTRRDPRSDAFLNRLQNRVFHGLVRKLTGQGFRDLSCGLRGMTAEVAHKLELYGDQHRFIPVVAVRHGFKVEEVPGNQHPGNRGLRLRGVGIYVRRLLDILNIYFLHKFTRKPLRFFGLFGLFAAALGGLLMFLLALQKVLFQEQLSDRPVLLLGALLFVLGIQVMSIGLLGEIVIFLSSKRDMPEVAEATDPREGGAAPAQVEGGEDGVVYRQDAV